MLVSIVFLLISVVMLFSIVVRRKIFNIHAIWALALKGDRLAIAYSSAIVLSFGFALMAALFELFGG